VNLAIEGGAESYLLLPKERERKGEGTQASQRRIALPVLKKKGRPQEGEKDTGGTGVPRGKGGWGRLSPISIWEEKREKEGRGRKTVSSVVVREKKGEGEGGSSSTMLFRREKKKKRGRPDVLRRKEGGGRLYYSFRKEGRPISSQLTGKKKGKKKVPRKMKESRSIQHSLQRKEK